MSQNIEFVKMLPEAVLPSKAHPSDVGLDLVCVKIHKILPNDVVMFDTGLVVNPPTGYYMEIIPRSSISKTCWTLANSVGIIDPHYRGNIYVALRCANTESLNQELPFCVCQLVLRKIEAANVVEVASVDNFSTQASDRNTGGFGSTGMRTN